jgi:hypothetical protein
VTGSKYYQTFVSFFGHKSTISLYHFARANASAPSPPPGGVNTQKSEVADRRSHLSPRFTGSFGKQAKRPFSSFCRRHFAKRAKLPFLLICAAHSAHQTGFSRESDKNDKILVALAHFSGGVFSFRQYFEGK